MGLEWEGGPSQGETSMDTWLGEAGPRAVEHPKGQEADHMYLRWERPGIGRSGPRIGLPPMWHPCSTKKLSFNDCMRERAKVIK